METKLNDIEKMLKQLLTKVNKIEESNKQINENTQILNEKIEFISKELEKVKKNEEKNRNDCVTLKKNNDFLMAENKVLKNEVNELRITTEKLLFKGNNSEVEIIGLNTADENKTKDSILFACRQWNIPIKSDEIENVEKQLNKNRNENKYRIKFKNEKLQSMFLIAAKKSRTKDKDFNIVGNTKQIYVNEILSPYAKKLLYYAKGMKKQQNWKYIWTKYGNIYIRKQENSPIIQLKSLDQLETIK